jgi:hypothetical protein
MVRTWRSVAAHVVLMGAYAVVYAMDEVIHDDTVRRLETVDDKVNNVSNPSSLVLNFLGLGVFIIGFLGLLTLAVFAATSHCNAADRFVVRQWTVIVFVVTTLILIFAQRQSQNQSGGYERRIYDDSIVPRILLIVIVGLFAYWAVPRLAAVLGENQVLSTIDNDHSALWQS